MSKSIRTLFSSIPLPRPRIPQSLRSRRPSAQEAVAQVVAPQFQGAAAQGEASPLQRGDEDVIFYDDDTVVSDESIRATMAAVYQDHYGELSIPAPIAYPEHHPAPGAARPVSSAAPEKRAPEDRGLRAILRSLLNNLIAWLSGIKHIFD